MTDTAGYSDVVFGLFWLLGYQLSPRLHDIRGLRYWRLDRSANCGRLDGVARHVIRPERIERHWEDLLRIAGSLKLGTVRASDLMRTLQSGGRVSRLRQAVAELGRMVKTLSSYRRPSPLASAAPSAWRTIPHCARQRGDFRPVEPWTS